MSGVWASDGGYKAWLAEKGVSEWVSVREKELKRLFG